MWNLFHRWSQRISTGRCKRSMRLPSGSFLCRTFELLEPRRLLAGADCTVVFNEVMYHPAGGNEDLEWIEIYNHNAIGVDMSNWILDGGVHMTFPKGTLIQAGQFLVAAANPTLLAASTGLNGILGPYSGHLSNGGEKILLDNNAGRLMDEVNYSDSGKWPLAADGSAPPWRSWFPIPTARIRQVGSRASKLAVRPEPPTSPIPMRRLRSRSRFR